MKLSDEQFKTLTELISNADLVDQGEFEYKKKTVPGVVNSDWYAKGEHGIKHYSTKNKELVSFLYELADNPSGELVTIHRGYYAEGTYNREHYDDATCTLVIMLDANLIQGGEFYLDGEYISELNTQKDYILYNGGMQKHRVDKIIEGFRDVLIVWWWDRELLKKQKSTVKSLL